MKRESGPEHAAGAAGAAQQQPQAGKAYDRVADRFPVEARSGAWERSEWLESSAKYTVCLRKDSAANRLVIEPYLSPVALAAAELARVQAGVTILDLGGGVGQCVEPVLSSLANRAGCDYVIVEGPNSCKMGRALYRNAPEVRFLETLPADIRPDIVLMSSALQYIHDWRGTLATLAGLRPRHIYISRLPIHSRGTVAVRQCNALAESEWPWHWLFSARELDEAMESGGYAFTFDMFIRDITHEVRDADPALGDCALRVRHYTPAGRGSLP